jgi:hypothetical protein
VVVAAADDLVRFDRRTQPQKQYTRQVQEEVARKLALPGGDVGV